MKRAWLVVLLFVGLSACADPAQPGSPVITVYKSSTCQCCNKWVQHLKDNGFAVKEHNESDMDAIKSRFGISRQLAACHTAVVEGYVVEGHVPAQDIRRLLTDKPAAKGIAVPGMPIGSPGMEQGDQKEPYQVLLFTQTGETSVYAKH
jgi:hypothetical protein